MARRFNRKPLTDEERDARRKAARDRIEQAARALLTTDGWQRWIKVRASNGLSRYSFGNQMILAIETYSPPSPSKTATSTMRRPAASASSSRP